MEQLDVTLIDESPVTSLSSHLMQDPDGDQPCDQIIGRWIGCPNQVLNFAHLNDGMLVEVFEYPMTVASGTAKALNDHATMCFTKTENSPCCVGCLSAHVHDAAQEEGQPLLPGPDVTYRLQLLVILLSVLFKERGQVEDWLEQHLLLAEQESDEQSPDAAIAVEERMNGLELCMHQPDLDQQRQSRVGMNELLQFCQILGNLVRRWRNEGGLP